MSGSVVIDASVDQVAGQRGHSRALELASHLRQDAAYDAHYLALAEILNCELWTADERFYRAASSTFKFVEWLAESEVGR